MIKKLISALILTLFLFPLCVIFAKEEAAPTLEPYGEFYTLKDKKLAEILNLSSDELENYVKENNVLFLAANDDNSKQIKLISTVTDFSSSVINISYLSNDKISRLTEDISGFEGVSGDIVKKGGQKFIKLELKSADGNEDYFLTQYITVAEKKTFVLSFYTPENDNIDFIEKTFESFKYQGFLEKSEEASALNGRLIYPIIILLGVFILIAGFIGYTFIRDLKSPKLNEEQNH